MFVKMIRGLCHKFFPPRISEHEYGVIETIARQTTAEANQVAEQFERIEAKAHKESKDPLAVLIAEVRKASFRRH